MQNKKQPGNTPPGHISHALKLPTPSQRIASMALLHVYRGHEGDVNHCDWSPVQPYIASAGGDKVIRIWDTNTGQELAQSPLKGHSYYVNSCVFSPNGDLLASSSSDGTVKLWSTTTWKIVGKTEVK